MHPSIRNQLILDNRKIVYQVVRALVARPDDDLYQAGMIGLIAAVDKYDPRKGKFYGYAKLHIRNEVQCYLNENKGFSRRAPRATKDHRAMNTSSAAALYGIESLNCPTGEDAQRQGYEGESELNPRDSFSLHNCPQGAIDARDTLEKALDQLSEDQIEALAAFLEGDSVTSIARGMGCSVQEAQDIIDEALYTARDSVTEADV